MQQISERGGAKSPLMANRRLAFAAIMVALVLFVSACSSEEPDDSGVAAVPLTDAVDGAGAGAGASDGEGAADDDAVATLDVQTGDAEAADVDPENPDQPSDAPDNPIGGADSQPAPAIESGKLAEEVGPILGETGDGLADDELEVFLARRYEAFWQAVDLARQAPSETPSVDYPELAQLADGQQLEAIYNDVESLFTSGHAIRDPETPAVPGLDANSAHRVRVELQGDAVAQLYGCLVNDQVRYEVPTGSVLNEAVITVTSRSTMARSDGTWKLIRSEATALEPGVGGCWLESEDEYPL